MSTAVIITLIICGTVVLVSIVSAIEKAHERKTVNKQIDKFSKAFPRFETPEKKDKDKDDFFKPF